MADASEVHDLLRVAELSKQWPNLQPIHDHAMARLQKIADEHKRAPAAPEEKKPQPAPPRTILRPTGGRDDD